MQGTYVYTCGNNVGAALMVTSPVLVEGGVGAGDRRWGLLEEGRRKDGLQSTAAGQVQYSNSSYLPTLAKCKVTVEALYICTRARGMAFGPGR